MFTKLGIPDSCSPLCFTWTLLRKIVHMIDFAYGSWYIFIHSTYIDIVIYARAHNRVYESPSLVFILVQSDPIHTCPIYFRSILVSACNLWRCSLRGHFLYRLSCESSECLCLLLFASNMQHQVYLPWFVHWLMLDEERNSLITSWCGVIQYIVWH